MRLQGVAARGPFVASLDGGRPSFLSTLLFAIFFLSGAAALLFETLWFHQAGLVFGNGVWASSLVLAGFMAGLALGNGIAARVGPRLRNPMLGYAGLEVVIGIAGVALVVGLPLLTVAFTPLLRPLLDQPWIANPIRLGAGFILLLIPSTAMGATLPLLVQALVDRESHFASALGKLYGWNTLGAMCGALLAELVLIEWAGIRGASFVAAGANAAAALGTLALRSRFGEGVARSPAGSTPALSPGARRVLVSAFLAGLLVLALEVVWFRFLLLFLGGSSEVFALMLASVLGGIALGGLAGGALWRRVDVPAAAPMWIAIAAAMLVAGTYAAYSAAPFEKHYAAPLRYVLVLAIPLMVPVAFTSGLMFTTLGTLLDREVDAAVRATGWLTLANTIGSGLGSLLGGFILLPWLGIEGSFFAVAIGYGGVALLLAPPRGSVSGRWALQVAAPLVALLGFLVLFPHGLMRSHYLSVSTEGMTTRLQARPVAVREGRTETIVLLQRDLLGIPVEHHLVTNGHGMSSSTMRAKRYMNLYAWWPRVFTPEPKNALLISYGLGNTARVLADTPGLEHIDVVDISREILELSEVVFPDPSQNPLRDERVQVHVEDGRYFLEVTDRRYDVITGEPPPPKNAGVVNLYTREYFQLVHDRLVPGGMHTYWLPVHNLTLDDTRAILAAYCEVFSECSLWTGAGLDWMLVGTRSGGTRTPDFQGLWADPLARSGLVAVGIEDPAQLGSLFLADAAQLDVWIDGAAPLVDDYPKRLTNDIPHPAELLPLYREWMDPDAARARFEASEWIAGTWPAEVREAALSYYEWQDEWNAWSDGMIMQVSPLVQARSVHRLLTETEMKTLPLVLLGVTPEELTAVSSLPTERHRNAQVIARRSVAALVEGRYDEAARDFAALQQADPTNPLWFRYRLLALCLGERVERANTLLENVSTPGVVGGPPYWAFMSETCGFDNPLER
jgi:predicted membrane-bound spermidine synthase